MVRNISEVINELDVEAPELAEDIAMSIDEAQDIDGYSSSSEVIEVIDYLDYIRDLYPEITEWMYLNENEILLNKITKIHLTKHAKTRKKQREIDITLNKGNLLNSYLGYFDKPNTYRLVYDNFTFILNKELSCVITTYKNSYSYYEWKNNDICRMEKEINKEIKKLEEKRKDLHTKQICNKIDEMIKLIQNDNTILTKLIESHPLPVNKKRKILETYINKLGGDITWKNIKKDKKKLNVNVNVNVNSKINNSKKEKSEKSEKSKKSKKSKKKKEKKTKIIKRIADYEPANTAIGELLMPKWTCKVCDKTICLIGKESHEKSKKHNKNLPPVILRREV